MSVSRLIIGTAAMALPLLAVASGAKAESGDQIGEAILVENLVTADYARDTRTLQTGDGVRQEERIEVGLDARSEFHLNDDTKLALGPGSRVVLDKFVYDADQASGSIMLNMVKGTMRWVTGVAKKPTYVIRVPNASITVRGTVFDLYVTDKQETWLLLHEGAVQVCNDRGQCRIHDQTCKLTRISQSGEVGRPQSWSTLPGAEDNMFHRAFPFVVLPPEIDPNPGCTRDGILGERDASAPPPRREQRASVERKYVPTAAVDEPDPRPKKQVRKDNERSSRQASRAPRDRDENYERPRREERAERGGSRERARSAERRERSYPRRERYAERDDDDDDDDRRGRNSRGRDRDDDDDDDRRGRRGGSGLGRAVAGAAVVGGAVLLYGLSKKGGY
ncbi:MAG: FecR family protein [Hyphomicrobium sp.]